MDETLAPFSSAMMMGTGTADPWSGVPHDAGTMQQIPGSGTYAEADVHTLRRQLEATLARIERNPA